MMLQRDNALTSGRDYYRDKIYLLYECKLIHLNMLVVVLILGNQQGIDNYSTDSDTYTTAQILLTCLR